MFRSQRQSRLEVVDALGPSIIRARYLVSQAVQSGFDSLVLLGFLLDIANLLR